MARCELLPYAHQQLGLWWRGPQRQLYTIAHPSRLLLGPVKPKRVEKLVDYKSPCCSP